MSTETELKAEVAARLRLLRSDPPRQGHWPEGCYGSALSWLMFVGPSPGGQRRYDRHPPRGRTSGLCLWNVEFDAPYADRPIGWGGKYRENMPVLVETIVGVPLKKGAGKLYGFANFDWVPSPKEQEASLTRMKQGETDVIELLHRTRPRIIVPTTALSHHRLMKCLRREGYCFFSPQSQRVRIRIDPKGAAYHRQMDAVKLLGSGALSGSVVIRIPQHPARMLYRRHGHRCARAIRKALIQVSREDAELTINEL